MGRKKAKMELIQGKSAKGKMYKDRGKTLKRKAKELSTLCGVDLCLIMVPPGDSAAAETWPKDNPERIHALIENFHSLRDSDQKRCKVTTVSDSIQYWIQEKEVELAKVRKMSLEARFPTSGDVFQSLPEESRRGFATFLTDKIEALRQKIYDISLINASTSNSSNDLLGLFPVGEQGYSLPSNDAPQNPVFYDTYNTMYYDNVAMSDQFTQPMMTSLPEQYVVEPMYGYCNVPAMPQMNALRWDEHPVSDVFQVPNLGHQHVSDVFQVPNLGHQHVSDVFQVPNLGYQHVSDGFQVPKLEHPCFSMEQSAFFN